MPRTMQVDPTYEIPAFSNLSVGRRDCNATALSELRRLCSREYTRFGMYMNSIFGREPHASKCVCISTSLFASMVQFLDYEERKKCTSA